MADGVFLACRRIGYTSKAKKRQINIILLWAIRESSLQKICLCSGAFIGSLQKLNYLQFPICALERNKLNEYNRNRMHCDL